jgi:hypothetical protein
MHSARALSATPAPGLITTRLRLRRTVTQQILRVMLSMNEPLSG